jgi:glycosyltransferase involved in cell wall biosynthesis
MPMRNGCSSSSVDSTSEEIFMSLQPDPLSRTQPLVSVIVYNYNYGRYLRQCLDSVLEQTYKNIEICFSDNASEDDSWEIALEYVQRYPGIMTITRNRRNFGSDANFANCSLNVRGKYMVTLCSDDALKPTFVEKCLSLLEAHQECAFAMVHRDILNDRGEIEHEAPFYSQSCIVPGPEQAAVYMMAAVNPSISQVMYRMDRLYGNAQPGGIATRWYGNRLLDFNLCRRNDMAYIMDPLMLHRLHSANDSAMAAESLLEVFGPFVLQHQLAEIASSALMEKAAARLPEALEKLGGLCIRYCVRCLLQGQENTARRYFHLAAAISPALLEDPVHREIQGYWEAESARRESILEVLRLTTDLTHRTRSYDPPPGSYPVDWESVGYRLSQVTA